MLRDHRDNGRLTISFSTGRDLMLQEKLRALQTSPCSTTAYWSKITSSSPDPPRTSSGHHTKRTRKSCLSRSRITDIRCISAIFGSGIFDCCGCSRLNVGGRRPRRALLPTVVADLQVGSLFSESTAHRPCSSVQLVYDNAINIIWLRISEMWPPTLYTNRSEERRV